MHQTFFFVHFEFYLWGFFRWRSFHVNKGECIFLVDMQHSQPYLSLYRAFFFLGCGGNLLRKFESLVMMLSSAYLASFSPPSLVVLAIILCISLTDTYNNNFGTNHGPACPYIYDLRQSLAIGYRKTWG